MCRSFIYNIEQIIDLNYTTLTHVDEGPTYKGHDTQIYEVDING